MLMRILADLAVGVHLAFILFVLFGGLLAFRWPKAAWLHVPAFLWGATMELSGSVCPLTYLENHLRALGAAEGYGTSFVEHYLLPVIYPELLFPGGFPRGGFVFLGVFVLVLNVGVYWRVWRRLRGVI
jgi:hypothetical protein